MGLRDISGRNGRSRGRRRGGLHVEACFFALGEQRRGEIFLIYFSINYVFVLFSKVK